MIGVNWLNPVIVGLALVTRSVGVAQVPAQDQSLPFSLRRSRRTTRRRPNALLSTTTIEWTDTPHTLEDRRAWLAQHRRAGEPVLVAGVEGEVAGFACYSDFRDSQKWPGYRFVVEHTMPGIGLKLGRWLTLVFAPTPGLD
jgi:hypothetical protein